MKRCLHPLLTVVVLLSALLNPFSAQVPLNRSKELLNKAKTFRTSNHDSAMHYTEKALELARSSNDKETEVDILHEQAYNYRENSQYDEALKVALEAKKTLLTVKDSTLHALNDYTLAGIYFEKDNTKEAIHYYLSAIKQFEQLKLYDKYTYSLNGVANTYSFANKPKEALEYYEKALAALKLTTNKRLPGTVNNNIGNFYFRQKQYDKAKHYLDIAEKLFIKAGLDYDLTNIYFNKGFINRDKNKIKEAIADFNKCITLGKKYDLYEDQVEAYSELEKIFISQKDYKNAYLCADSFRTITTKLHTQNIEQTISELETKFKLEEKNQLIEAKQQEIALDEKKIAAEKIAIIALVAFLALLAIFVFLMFYALRKNKQKNQFLSLQNNEISLSKDKINKALIEKETLIKEIHHRVKNNLQVISSLLNLQVSSNNNDEVKKQLNVAKDRIHAISLVHQKLYAENNFERINMAEYIHDIVNQQKIALQTTAEIRTEIHAQNVYFNLTTSVPIGIILNELITNCFKYAFNKSDKGNISISINAITENNYLLKVHDDGSGFPENFNIKNLSSLGMEIITSLTEQIEGTVNCYNLNGACVEIRFKEIGLH